MKALMQASIHALTREAELQARLDDEKIKRLERAQDWLEKVATMRAEHAKEIRELDVARQSNVRQVDILNANTAELRAQEAIKTLATQTAAIAETGRLAVANTATTIANQLTSLFAESNKRLSALELVGGQTTGKSAGIATSMGTITFVVGLLLGLIGIGTFAFITSRQAQPTPPPVILVPASPGTLVPSPTSPIVPR